MMFLLLTVALLATAQAEYPANLHTPAWKAGEPLTQRWSVPCSSQYAESEGGFVPHCHPTEHCSRVVREQFVSVAAGHTPDGQTWSIFLPRRGCGAAMDQK